MWAGVTPLRRHLETRSGEHSPAAQNSKLARAGKTAAEVQLIQPTANIDLWGAHWQIQGDVRPGYRGLGNPRRG
eukprot:3342697-Pyramimonas_sp.AAC.1